jgi:hypothetical protein
MQRLPWLTLAASSWLALAASAGRADDELPPLSIYGSARLDVLADDARMSDLAQPMSVLPGGDRGPPGGELTMTPRLSQVGLRLDRWQIAGDATGEGTLEVDFAGDAGTTALRLRQAYASIWLAHTVELVAGQTQDLISPLVPSAQNDTQLLFAGNTGDRRPQLQLALTPGDHVRAAVGVASTGWISHADADHDGQLDGTASMRPMLQWLLEVRQPLRGDVLRLGVWGHLSSSQLADGTRYGGASLGMHAYLPLTRRLVALGEAYLGHDLADIGGAIDQGYNAMTHRTIHGAGGWLELASLPTRRHMIAVGASIDSARTADLDPGDRARNATIYGVVRYKPLSSLQLGLEYLSWQTRYKAAGRGVANRVDLHLSVLF